MHQVIYPLLLPLIFSIFILFAKHSGLSAQRIFSFILLTALIFASSLLLLDVLQNDFLTYQLGDWEAPFGISLVADRLSVIMVLVTSVLGLAAMMYTVANDIDRKGEHFHVLFALQLFGINGAFLTGDLFNMFVFFEILLLASYSLLLHGGGRERTKAGLHYVVLNLVGSTLFLFAVGALYGILGTLNIADLAVEISKLGADNKTIVAAAGLLLLLVFGLKAAMFPLYLWLPKAYGRTSAPVAALFAVMTKVGLYAIIRVHGTLFGDMAGDLAGYYEPWLLNIGFLTIILATFGVMSAKRMKDISAYLVIVSVAVLLIALGIPGADALSGAIYYMIHSTFAAGGLFLLAGIIEKNRGASKDFFFKGPKFEQSILIGSLFFILAVAIAGLPPFSGFIGKVMILSAALGHMHQTMVFALILLSSLFVVISMAKAGSQLFYDVDEEARIIKPQTNALSFISVIILASFAGLMVVFAGPVEDFTSTAASQLDNVRGYVHAVLYQ